MTSAFRCGGLWSTVVARWSSRLLLALSSLLPSALVAAPPPPAELPTVLKRMTVEELLAQEVVSVSRRAEQWGQAASNVFVLHGEAARVSGAKRLPELLRLAPNLFVAQSSSSHWGISARGFLRTNGYSNKLLVLVDGRTVYSPFFSNVFWDVTDVFLPDLERVEVISGPAGAYWGSNAVNGVINVLSRSAHATQGSLVTAGAGSEEQVSFGLRHGGRFGATGAFRVYAKAAKFDATLNSAGAADDLDEWNAAQTGFRADWGRTGENEFTLQGDAYQARFDAGSSPQTRADGANLNARWTRTLANESQLLMRAYHDYAMRDIQQLYVAETHTTDVELQHQQALPGEQYLVWGGHYRAIQDHVSESVGFAILPRNLRFDLAGVFAQHDFSWRTWRLSSGLRLEHNDFTGWETQPTVRLAWRPDPRHTFWVSGAHSTRTPSRLEVGFFAPAEPPFVIGGGPDFAAETLRAAELGWRATYGPNLSISASLYSHDYDRLRSAEPGQPIVQANGVRGRSRGLEAFIDWEPSVWWRVRLGGFVMDQATWRAPGSADLDEASGESSFPAHQVLLRQVFQLRRDVTLWLSLRRVADLPAFDAGIRGEVPAYTELDARLGWQVRPDIEVALAGRNLLDSSHPEIGLPSSWREIRRSVHASIRWTF